MTGVFRYTLLADGTSDEVLVPILDWLLDQHLPDQARVGAFARDFGRVGTDLKSRLEAAVAHFPCDLLFVHRDAEGMSRLDRLNEIEIASEGVDVPIVPVIPVRMTEAWLLGNEQAIRFASGNLSGTMSLHLPPRHRWEALPDPKATLTEALKIASGKTGRRANKFSPERARHLITPRIASFAMLRGIPAFDLLEADIIQKLENFRNALD